MIPNLIEHLTYHQCIHVLILYSKSKEQLEIKYTE